MSDREKGRQILKECLDELWEEEMRQLEEEMKDVEPHVFSERHERNIAALLGNRK